MSSYTVSVRGAVPPDLAQRIAEAHATAILKKPTSALNAPVGISRVADHGGKPHS